MDTKLEKTELSQITTNELMLIDRYSLMKKKNKVNKLRSKNLALKRQSQHFCLEYPEALPISQKKQQIYDAILSHQVVIIAGETGSGKTTQLPKICLEMGRGIYGNIGHTQPRRIAARSVASRLSQELQVELGEVVGYQIRFKSHTTEHTLVKLMTDGVLLAEIQKDPLLYQYDTLIIDEAHERSLNIDFLLGYLTRILPQRPDLKIIITSATIDVQRFSTHFNHAPVIEVSGRSYPVTIRYSSFDSERDLDQTDKIIQAIDALSIEKVGDILVFLSGEKEIRDTSEALLKLSLPHTDILPLFSRLSASEQNRVFSPSIGRRIILATNVAETSLTIPSVRYVIDTGMVRISRYSIKNKVQRLPIEAISKASANQRAGRCGRVSDGICIRLYSEEDYLARPDFTQPEILRTNLASVILQMCALGLGDIKTFPFIQAPEPRYIQDGIKLLQEIGALKRHHGAHNELKLSTIGKQLAQLPIDPRLARMIIEARQQGCVREVLIITAALSIIDPREIPLDKKQQAQEKHRVHYDESSDFITFINLWHYLKEQQKNLTSNQFRKLCQREYLNYLRVREWEDLYNQLKQIVKEMGYPLNSEPVDYRTLHLSLLIGIPSHIGQKNLESSDYRGARGITFALSPSSVLFKKIPKWCVVGNLTETNRLWGSCVAQIQPEWLESVAPDLLQHHYSEPFWSKKQGAVLAKERITLYGLPIVTQRLVSYGKIDPIISRELFIRHALLAGEWHKKYTFFQTNNTLLNEVEELEHKARRRDIVVTDEILYQFYDTKIPNTIVSITHFDQWYKTQLPQILFFEKESLINQELAQLITETKYPDVWQQHDFSFKLSYNFSPNDESDGVTIHIPLLMLNQVSQQGFDWQVPGLRKELVTALIKSLPKKVRKNFVPAPNYTDAFLARVVPSEGNLLDLLEKVLKQISGVTVSREDWDWSAIPKHLRILFSIEHENNILLQGRDLAELKNKLNHTIQEKIVTDIQLETAPLEKQTTWTFSTIEQCYKMEKQGYTTKVYPALVDEITGVSLQLFNSEQQQQAVMLQGLTRLLLLNLPSPIKYLQDKLPNKSKLALYFNPYGQINQLINDCITCAVQSLINEYTGVTWSEADYLKLFTYVRAELNERTVIVANKVEKILLLSFQLSKKLKGKLDLQIAYSLSDVKQQLQQLVYNGFVTSSGLTRLDAIFRYLLAIEKRLDKLFIDPNKDRAQLLKLEPLTKQWLELITMQKTYPELEVENIQIRWMLEELRVSYFAQQLGTAYPISDKRINQIILKAKELIKS